MNQKNNKQKEIEKSIKLNNWEIAIGLQDVDRLKVSSFLHKIKEENIEGKINIFEAVDKIKNYYDNINLNSDIVSTFEADIVSARIVEILNETDFSFSSSELKNIHKKLFSDLISNAGRYRTYNITKKEWILNGDTVIYSPYDILEETVNYDLNLEKDFKYQNLGAIEVIEHFSKFISGLWQIHPFIEGNTRTTAIFFIKYLNTFGLEINNEPFKNNSWYFRNALVRANYNNMPKNIYKTTEYLNLFLRNLLLKENNELENQFLHIDYKKEKNKI